MNRTASVPTDAGEEGVKKFFNNIIGGNSNYEKRIKALEDKIVKLESLYQNSTGNTNMVKNMKK